MIKKFLIGTLVVAMFAVTAMVASAADFGTTTLKVGSKGEAVKALQTLVGADVDGNFGPMTKVKVIAWQVNNGLKGDGLFGAMSRAKANVAVTANFPAGCSSAAGFSTVTGLACTSLNANTFPAGCTNASGFSPLTGVSCGSATPVVSGVLTGGAGVMSADKITTDVNNYMVEGQSDVKVLGFKVLASDSDVKVSNVKVTLERSVAGSTYLDRYVSDVSVWMGSKKVATVDAADFNKDTAGKYSKSIALDNAIVKMGSSNKATFYVTVSGISNIDSTDMSAKWTVTANDFRYQDATGVVMTYLSGDLATLTNLLTIKDINTTGDVKLVISKDTTTSPDIQNVKISNSSSTSEIPMLAFKAKNTGADMTFDAMSFTVTSTTSPVAMIGELALKANGTTIATWTPATADTATGAKTVAFNLDTTYKLLKDSTTLFTVEAKINDIDNFTSGALTVSYDATAATATVFEVASTRTALTEDGTAIGGAQTFFANGVTTSSFTAGNPSVVTAQSGDTTSASYAITFKVTASGNSYYILKSGLTATGATGIAFSDLSASNATSDGSYWLVSDGSTATFTTTGIIPDQGVAGFKKIVLSTLKYNLATTGTDSTYTFAPATNYETSSTYFTQISA